MHTSRPFRCPEVWRTSTAIASWIRRPSTPGRLKQTRSAELPTAVKKPHQARQISA